MYALLLPFVQLVLLAMDYSIVPAIVPVHHHIGFKVAHIAPAAIPNVPPAPAVLTHRVQFAL